MRNNVSNFRKIGFKLCVGCTKIIAHFNHPLYMKVYLPLLKKKGMDISGNPIYIGSSTQFDGKDYSKIHIGDKVVISSDVRFLTHDYSISRAIEATGRKLEKEVFFLRDIYIGDNSFIGTKSILLPGTTIGKNVIVGAGSVVRGKVEDNSIVMGNPATVIGNTIEWAEKKIDEDSFLENK